MDWWTGAVYLVWVANLAVTAPVDQMLIIQLKPDKRNLLLLNSTLSAQPLSSLNVTNK